MLSSDAITSDCEVASAGLDEMPQTRTNDKVQQESGCVQVLPVVQHTNYTPCASTIQFSHDAVAMQQSNDMRDGSKIFSSSCKAASIPAATTKHVCV
jgi:hypothetical protein